MRLPKRKSQQLRRRDDSIESNYLTKEGVERLKRTIKKLEAERPSVVEALSAAIQLGDLSENAEYREAKHHLSQIDGRLFSLENRIKNAIIIDQSSRKTGDVQLGSTVTLEVSEKQKIYTIVGPQETNPSQGRISHVSPLGEKLLHKQVGDIIELQSESGSKQYKITKID